jgi:IS4 transposase
MHTLLDLRGSIPSLVIITHGKVHDVNIFDHLTFEAGAFYIMDRAYLKFAKLYIIHHELAFFVTRTKSNFKFKRLYSNSVDKTTGVQCDQIIMLTGYYQKIDYPEKLRRIRFFDAESNKHLIFLTNNFTLPADTIAQLYKCRWQVELFFKWIKQNLRIKSFYGTSENAVKSQIWIAISVYVLIAIVKKKLKLEQSLYTILQILSVIIFEQTPFLSAFQPDNYNFSEGESHKQLTLFN